MALDGIFLSKIKAELCKNAIGLRVDKVQQPGRDEIVLVLRGKSGAFRLLFCLRADSPRVHFTAQSIEAPAVPPMFCMLLRKHLTGAKIVNIRQQENDRILFFDLDASNEIGDRVSLCLCAEIMGKYSNLILVNEQGKIIDSIKRVDISTSSVRQILPGLLYKLPPKQDKLSLQDTDTETLLQRILFEKNKMLSSSLMNTVQGISPIVAREISFMATGDDCAVSDLTLSQINALKAVLDSVKNQLQGELKAYMLVDENKKPKEVCFLYPNQYGSLFSVREFEGPSQALDVLYSERDRINRVTHRGQEMFKQVSVLLERTARKLNIRREELKKCEDKEKLRLSGELIMANLHRLKKGTLFYDIENYYDSMKVMRIPCNPALSPTDNANKYYRDYRKAKTAELKLAELIKEGESELSYFESVLDELSRANGDSELSAIRAELCEGGYLKNKSGKKQFAKKPLPPIEYQSTDGYRILVGRNNVQNDNLSMKKANNNDVWLHTQGFPGSHVIIENKGGEVSDLSIEQAAVIAAYHSKARESSLVNVDYTRVRNLKKPIGAKPGKVIYHEYFTITVNLDKALVEKLSRE